MFSLFLGIGFVFLRLSQPVLSDPTPNIRCSSFSSFNSSVDAVVNNTQYFDAGDLVLLVNPFAGIFTTDLPAFCRVVLTVTTNVTAGSTAQTEVWLPDNWNGRFLGLGNGGVAGGGNW